MITKWEEEGKRGMMSVAKKRMKRKIRKWKKDWDGGHRERSWPRPWSCIKTTVDRPPAPCNGWTSFHSTTVAAGRYCQRLYLPACFCRSLALLGEVPIRADENHVHGSHWLPRPKRWVQWRRGTLDNLVNIPSSGDVTTGMWLMDSEHVVLLAFISSMQ